MSRNFKKRLLAIAISMLLLILHALIISHFELNYDPKSFRTLKDACPKSAFSNSTDIRPNCDAILNGDQSELCKWSWYHRSAPTEREFMIEFEKNRSLFLARYQREASSLEESRFPIAFSISLHKNMHQFERLLRLIYWPQNLYCVHVDLRSSKDLKLAVQMLAEEFPNVFITKSEPVYWAGFGVLQAVLNCMNDTLVRYPNHAWRYFINLSGLDFPLKTNLELVRILRLLNGSNDVEFGYELQFSRYWFSYRSVTDPSGYPYTHVPLIRRSKTPPPHRLKIYKGNLAATVSRRFVEYVFADQRAWDFIDWLRDTDTADEHLWATLNYNALSGAPGSFPAECHNDTSPKSTAYFSRFAVWRGESLKKRFCSGRYVRDVCIFGIRDIQHLIRTDTRMELFANKLYADFQSSAFECMEEWFLRRTREKRTDVNITFYSNLPNVIYQRTSDKSCINRDQSKNQLPPEVRKYVKGAIVNRGKL